MLRQHTRVGAVGVEADEEFMLRQQPRVGAVGVEADEKFMLRQNPELVQLELRQMLNVSNTRYDFRTFQIWEEGE